MSLREEIDGIRFLFLSRIGEPEDNTLVLAVQEGLVGPAEDVELLGVKIENTRPVTVEEGSRGYVIYFNRYVAYSVRNESYASFSDEEVWEGDAIREYTKSYYLDFVGAATFASEEYPGPLRHWGVMCENHIVDVVSTEEPEMERWTGA